jgi:hypothetical protein
MPRFVMNPSGLPSGFFAFPSRVRFSILRLKSLCVWRIVPIVVLGIVTRLLCAIGLMAALMSNAQRQRRWRERHRVGDFRLGYAVARSALGGFPSAQAPAFFLVVDCPTCAGFGRVDAGSYPSAPFDRPCPTCTGLGFGMGRVPIASIPPGSPLIPSLSVPDPLSEGWSDEIPY